MEEDLEEEKKKKIWPYIVIVCVIIVLVLATSTLLLWKISQKGKDNSEALEKNDNENNTSIIDNTKKPEEDPYGEERFGTLVYGKGYFDCDFLHFEHPTSLWFESKPETLGSAIIMYDRKINYIEGEVFDYKIDVYIESFTGENYSSFEELYSYVSGIEPTGGEQDLKVYRDKIDNHDCVVFTFKSSFNIDCYVKGVEFLNLNTGNVTRFVIYDSSVDGSNISVLDGILDKLTLKF